ncbi:MAG: VCBS repeat-containing protein [Candidatus Binatia bacterium]|nr:VCBS repeat-containing protein [Candidatus Binatia bacterium]
MRGKPIRLGSAAFVVVLCALAAEAADAATPRPTRTPTPSRTPRGTVAATFTATPARPSPTGAARETQSATPTVSNKTPTVGATTILGSPTPSATPTVNPFGAAVLFRSAVEIGSVGERLTGIAAGSVDVRRGNQFLDLVVADGSAGGVRWLEGRGTGAFLVRGFSAVIANASHAVLADFDEDDVVDVATIDPATSTVAVALGRGDGSFAPEIAASIGGDLRALTAVDHFLAVADAANNQVILLEVELGPVLSVIGSLPVGREPAAVAAGDFDTNGLTDLAVGNHGSGDVSILRQGAGRAFSPFATVAVGSGVSAVGWGDVNGDGAADLIAARQNGEIVVFRNDARRSFSRLFAMGVGQNPAAVLVLDDRSPGQVVNGDGRADMVILHRGANDIGVLTGLGDGRFETSSRLVVGADPVGLVVGNFDEDEAGAVDLATANAGADTVSVIRGQGGGSFVAALSFATGVQPVALQLADFDRDGLLDALALNGSDGTLSLLRGNGRGSFHPRKDFAALSGATVLAAGDFDGDGFVDAAVARRNESRITILPNSVSGFGLPRIVPVQGGISTLVGSDLDRDGRGDLIVLESGTQRALVLRSNGAFTFETRMFDLGGIGTTATVGEVFGDANPDFVVGTSDPPGIDVFAGIGGAEFQLVEHIDLPGDPAYVAIDDFVGDGKPDIAVLSPTAQRLDLFAGNGLGRWQLVSTQSISSDSGGLAAADLNGNGAADLVTAGRLASRVTVWSGDGQGNFSPITFAVGAGPTDVRVAHLNVVSDATGGLAEVVSLNTDADTVTVLRNITRATLPPATATPTVGPGTPPPPEPPTPLPTRTRRPAGSSSSSGGCAIPSPAGGADASHGLLLLFPPFWLWGRAWFRLRRLRLNKAARTVH